MAANSSPSFSSDGRLIISGEDGVYAGLLNGNQAWQIPFEADGGLAACDDAGHVFYVSGDGRLHAVSSANGADLWPSVYNGGGAVSPAITADGSLVIVGGNDSLIQAFHVSDGTPAWTPIQTGGAIECSPAITSDGKILVGSDDGLLRAVKPDGGDPAWLYDAASPIATSPVIGTDGAIYVTSANGVLHAVNSDGTGRWTLPLGCSEPSTGAITISGILYLTASFGGDDSLIAINTSDHTRRWGVMVPDLTGSGIENSPVITADGMVLVTSNDPDVGGVYAFWGTDGLAQSSWPMLQHDAARTGKAKP